MRWMPNSSMRPSAACRAGRLAWMSVMTATRSMRSLGGHDDEAVDDRSGEDKAADRGERRERQGLRIAAGATAIEKPGHPEQADGIGPNDHGAGHDGRDDDVKQGTGI